MRIMVGSVDGGETGAQVGLGVGGWAVAVARVVAVGDQGVALGCSVSVSIRRVAVASAMAVGGEGVAVGAGVGVGGWGVVVGLSVALGKLVGLALVGVGVGSTRCGRIISTMLHIILSTTNALTTQSTTWRLCRLLGVLRRFTGHPPVAVARRTVAPHAELLRCPASLHRIHLKSWPIRLALC